MSRSGYRRTRRSRRARTFTASELRRIEVAMQALETRAGRWEARALQREAALAEALERAAVWQARVEELEIVAVELEAAGWQSKAEELEVFAAEAQAQTTVLQARTHELQSTAAEAEAQAALWQARAEEQQRSVAQTQAQLKALQDRVQELEGIAAIAQSKARLEEEERLAAEAKAAAELSRIARALRDERWFSYFFAALVLVWAGLVLLLGSIAEATGSEVTDVSAWVATGAGLLFWIEALLRLVMPAYRTGIAEGVVLGMVLIIVGLGQLTDVSLWPLMLVAVGVGTLVFGFGMESRRI